jgi:membrane protease YdiL (CAAX protease family)
VATVVRVLAPGPALATLALVLRARGRSVRHELALRWPLAVPRPRAPAGGAGYRSGAPVAEELIFRGALFTQLERTRLRAGGAVAGTAIALAAWERLGL